MSAYTVTGPTEREGAGPITWKLLQRYYKELQAADPQPPGWFGLPAPEEPAVYDVAGACRMLGNISRTTLWREILLGNLETVPGIKRCLVTRESLLAWADTKKRRAAAQQASLR